MAKDSRAFLRTNRVVQIKRSRKGEMEVTGFGLSVESESSDATRHNVWFMIDDLLRTTEPGPQGDFIEFGAEDDVSSIDTAVTLDAFIRRVRKDAKRLPERRQRTSCWVDAYLRSFDRKPDIGEFPSHTLTPGEFPSLENKPSLLSMFELPPPSMGHLAEDAVIAMQVDTGTIGLSPQPPEEPVSPAMADGVGSTRAAAVPQNGALYVYGNGHTRHEIWVVDSSFAIEPPPGANGKRASFYMMPSTLFAEREPTGPQDFLDRAWDAMNEPQVFLVAANFVRDPVMMGWGV